MTQSISEELVGYNCKKCKGKNFHESGNTILHLCEGFAEPVMKTSISEEFAKKFYFPFQQKTVKYEEVLDFLQSKISQALTAEREKPMGVSQWKEHGIKNGYWDYFKEQIIAAERKEQRERLEKYDIVPPQVKMENPYYWEGCQYAVKKIIALLEEK